MGLLTYNKFILKEAVSNNDKGVMHELLVGYHLRGGKHMIHHKGKTGETPKEVHDRMKENMHPHEYKALNDRAKETAKHLKNHIESHGHSIHNVHWTSKPGDLEKSTKIPATQKEDASDIVVHAKDHKGKTKYHGVSLKVSDTTNKHVGVATSGKNSTYGAHEHLEKFREHINKKYPGIKAAGNKQKRKAFIKTLPHEDQKYISDKQTETNKLAAKHIHDHLQKAGTHAIANHIREHILASHQTPMEKEGHHHWRATTYKSKNGYAHHVINPHAHYEHMLSDHKNLSTQHSGTSVNFYYKGKKIGTHNMKMNSKSDPHSSMESRGIPSA